MNKGKYIALWVSLTILAVILCAVNVLLACLYNNCGANIFTAISGWVSGIAAIVLGVIAVLQNKKYTLASTKREIKDNIRSEQIMLADICDGITQYSSLKKPLNILVNDKVEGKDLLLYNLEMDMLREQLLTAAHKMQLFNYIPCNMNLLVKMTTEMMIFINTGYKSAAQQCHNDSTLSVKIEKISQFIVSWVRAVTEQRKQAARELDAFSKNIDRAKSVSELHEILLSTEQQTVNAQNELKAILEKCI
ncbi:MAG: hypothetical protein K2M47_08165 [Clostridiales bacterium]|nr:hypothetical protein [Clostridiales bacterium]